MELLSHPSCTLCPLHSSARSVGIPTIHLSTSLSPSPSHPIVLFLGQNPGFNEDESNQPFIGRSGSLLKDVIIAGVSLTSLASIFLGNTARCYHVSGDGPSASQYRTCSRAYLPNDLLYLSSLPHSSLIVVTLGAHAARYLYDLFSIPKISLSKALARQASHLTLSSPSLSITAFSTYHPAAVLRDNKLIHPVSDHLQLVVDYIEGVLPTPSSPHIIPPRSPTSAQEEKLPRSKGSPTT